MTAVVQSSSPSSIQCGSPTPNDELRHNPHLVNSHFDPPPLSSTSAAFGGQQRPLDTDTAQEDELSVLALFVTAFRKSLIRCYNKGAAEVEDSISSSSSSWAKKMEIGFPTSVRHVAHVTFDRFNGFLGLPVEFEPEVPRRPPSASTTVFGVSTNSMQLSFDALGNSVPSILLMMQRRLYALGGLEVEGIFRINAGNDQEEYVRDQLNRGVVPDDADVHCLAGLIKAWFRELPTGLLDSLSPEELMQSQTEEECLQLARTLPLTEAFLLDWAINLMADIAQYEHLNKMNPRNVAVVFAPNMTHVLDPLTALMHAVQVMNFLKTLILRTLRKREDVFLDAPLPTDDPSDENGPLNPFPATAEGTGDGSDVENEVMNHKPSSKNHPHPHPHPHFHLILQDAYSKEGHEDEDEDEAEFLNSIENILIGDSEKKPPSVTCNGSGAKDNSSSSREAMNPRDQRKVSAGRMIKLSLDKGKRNNEVTNQTTEKNKGTDIVSLLNPRSERIEAWR